MNELNKNYIHNVYIFVNDQSSFAFIVVLLYINLKSI